jgi:LysM repeat protein
MAGLAAMVSAALILTPAFALAGPAAVPPAQGEGSNLLQDGDFEGGGPVWPLQNGIGEVQVAPGWRAYYRDVPPPYVVVPEFCYDPVTGKRNDNGCYWARPEFRDVTLKFQPNRIHGGQRAQKYFSYGRMHEAGLMQRVTGVISSTLYHYSIYMQAWMCVDYIEACKGGYVSDKPTQMHLKVGIDPTGGIDPSSPNIVWSPEVESFDRWTQYSVEAVAKGDILTVFTHSRAEWVDMPRQNNDVYLDDASLTAVGAPPPSPTATAGAASALAAPAPATLEAQKPQTFVVRPQGNQRTDGQWFTPCKGRHTVRIALAYGVTVDELVQLNQLQTGDFLQIGQALIVKGTPASAPAPAPQPAGAVPQPTAVASKPAAVAAALAKAGLCVQAFNDRNTNGLYDGNEELVANIEFDVLSSAEQVATYTTNGVDEPHCLTDLPSGAYTVRIVAPMNYAATTDQQMGVALASGQTANPSLLAFSRRAARVQPRQRPDAERGNCSRVPVERLQGFVVWACCSS